DSAIELPKLSISDEEILKKYGSQSTYKFADIGVHGSHAFLQKGSDPVTRSMVSMCT
ncbi:hypothetical protein BJ878DRAFT_431397, partial [Calycina marina]